MRGIIMKIQFFGAARTVTGSNTMLTFAGKQILIDCGLHQGKNSDDLNRQPFPFNPSKIDYVLLTHAHIDHSGRLPLLVKNGYSGSIIATDATVDLVEILLLDTARIQEKDAEWLTKRRWRAGIQDIVEPLYTVEDVQQTLRYFVRKPYRREEVLTKGMLYRFFDAGHILGSGSLELRYWDSAAEKRIVFSGDIGKWGNPIVADPEHAETADYVVMEATYGNRLHKPLEESLDELAEAINETFRRGGNVLIPAFAVGRTQDVLYLMNRLVSQKRLKPLDVYVDSPLAEEATQIYLNHPELFDREAAEELRRGIGTALKLHFTKTVEDSMKINRIHSGAVIIAGSGMCDGGRIRHHFKHNLWRPECSVIFVGFQAEGTLGRQIIEGKKRVTIFDEDIAVKAKIYTIGGFSAHADQRELLQWLRTFTNKPDVFIIHAEESVAFEFAHLVSSKIGCRTYVPEYGETFTL
jgi:metallo-beta-lactamase family protein